MRRCSLKGVIASSPIFQRQNIFLSCIFLHIGFKVDAFRVQKSPPSNKEHCIITTLYTQRVSHYVHDFLKSFIVYRHQRNVRNTMLLAGNKAYTPYTCLFNITV